MGFGFLPRLTLMVFLNSKGNYVWCFIAVIASRNRIELFDQKEKGNQHQGVGNAVSGLIGGLPITSVIVRSSANVMQE